VALFSGCVLEDIPETARPTTLVLRYTLIDEDDESGRADVGGHCGEATVGDGQARVERSSYAAMGTARPFIIVLPALEGNWASLGTGGFVVKVPGDVDARIKDDEVVVAHIEWLGNSTHGHAEVDGDAVPLPYSWTQRNTKEGWRIEAELSIGPSVVKTYDAGGPCI
ncbi:MAG TPA: hypothetical protein VGB18_07520, partial [Candidatus Thermoplasmatota archaeon]